MAGAYPDVPGRRMGWDADGTVAVERVLTGQLTELTPAQKAEMNDEENVTVISKYATSWQFVLLFPEKREIDGLFIAGDAVGSVYTSADTTSGLDGTWGTLFADFPESPNAYNDYRTGIQSSADPGKRGLDVRVANYSGYSRLYAVHVYGEISPGETPDRLLFIDEATGLEFAAAKDYGDTPRGSARDFSFRLKNNSTVAGNNVTLNTIQVTAEDLFLGSGAWYTFSYGGGAFQGTIQIASLAPEATSQLIVCRQIIPTDETLGPHAGRVKATVGSLS